MASRFVLIEYGGEGDHFFGVWDTLEEAQQAWRADNDTPQQNWRWADLMEYDGSEMIAEHKVQPDVLVVQPSAPTSVLFTRPEIEQLISEVKRAH